MLPDPALVKCHIVGNHMSSLICAKTHMVFTKKCQTCKEEANKDTYIQALQEYNT